MDTQEEVDKILDTSCTVTESHYTEMCDMFKDYYDKMIIQKSNMNLIKQQLDTIAIEVALRLADFSEVLDYIQDESLAEEINLNIRSKDFTRKELETYKTSLVVEGGDESNEDCYRVGTIDSYDRCFYCMIEFPKTFLYRADWIYKLVVEKEAYLIKRSRL